MTQPYYPPGAFYFSVTLMGSLMPASAGTSVDASFQEVSGIQAEFGLEEVAEGGENRFVHRLPRPARYSHLVLKRGVITTDSVLGEWVGQTVGSGLGVPIIPQNLLVTLLDEEGSPLVAWGFANAFPVKWDFAPLNSMENKYLTETLVFSYNYFERLTVSSSLSAATKLGQFTSRSK